MDAGLRQFHRQYLQQLIEILYPAPSVLLQPWVQDQIFRYMFDERTLHLPPVNYQRRVLKAITEKIESAIQDPEEDDISENLMQHMAHLSTLQQPPPVELAQQRTVVSYYLPSDIDSDSSRPLLIEEARNLLALGGNVGFRTWDACLRLASFLSTEGRPLIHNKNVLELGAGTGLLSILCAGYLQATHVLSTDGVADVVTSINRNIQLNQPLFVDGAARAPTTKVLDWTDLSEISEILKHQGALPTYDIILGSDITYNLDYFTPLVDTFDAMEKLFPGIDIIISGAIRNINTFNAFIKACADKNFDIAEIPFDCPPFHQQKGFFHATALTIRIVSITRKRQSI